MRNYRELQVWQKAMDIGVATYALTKLLPSEERFGLVSQMNRAAVSVSSNIAEGGSRSTNKDFARFLEIALGSTYELESQVVLCERVGLVEKDATKIVLVLINEEQRMLTVFIQKLKSHNA